MDEPIYEPPPSSVLEEFGLSEAPARLEGGEGRAYISEDIVLKPVALRIEAAWKAETLSRVKEDGFRVERPVRTRSDEWVAGGWAGWRHVPGEHDTKGRWKEVLDVTDAFHRSLENVARPDFLDIRDTPWDIGDRVAWGEVSVDLPPLLVPLVEELQAKLRPLDLPSQVVHGDMARNVLFAEGLPPAVIDFSPYFRPVGFASAIVMVDALTWYGADASILSVGPNIRELGQLLLRAAIYRLVTTGVAFPTDEGRLTAEFKASRPVVEQLVGSRDV